MSAREWLAFACLALVVVLAASLLEGCAVVMQPTCLSDCHGGASEQMGQLPTPAAAGGMQ